MRIGSFVLSVCLLAFLAIRALANDAPDTVLFKFDNPGDAAAWTAVTLADAKTEQPAPEIEVSAPDPTGERSLQIAFAGGQWPTIGTTAIPVAGTWQEFETIKADLTLPAGGIVYLGIGQGPQDPKALKPQWHKTLILRPGRNEVTLLIRHGLPNLIIDPKRGQITSFVIGMFQPQAGQVLTVHAIRLSREWPEPRVLGWYSPYNHDGYSAWSADDYRKSKALPPFKVLGTDWQVESFIELSKKLKDGWRPVAERTIEQAEADFQASFAELKKSHPSAVLAIFRDGEKGFDPASPEKIYAGWKNAYMSSHGPDGPNAGRESVGGLKGDTTEAFMRHRCVLLQADLSSIPKGATILAARLVITRAPLKEHGNPAKPNLWITEPCTRDWEESAVNCYSYANGKHWKAVNGLYYGEDPDFYPIMLSHSPGSAPVNDLEFTHALKFWIEEGHANHGFVFYCDSGDYMRMYTRLAKDIRQRPAVFVIYSPK